MMIYSNTIVYLYVYRIHVHTDFSVHVYIYIYICTYLYTYIRRSKIINFPGYSVLFLLFTNICKFKWLSVPRLKSSFKYGY